MFDLLLEATQADEKILRSEAVIRTLKAVKLAPDHQNLRETPWFGMER